MALTKPTNHEPDYFHTIYGDPSGLLDYTNPRNVTTTNTDPSAYWTTVGSSTAAPSHSHGVPWPATPSVPPFKEKLSRSDATLQTLKGTILRALLDRCTSEELAEKVAPIVHTLVEELKKEYTF